MASSLLNLLIISQGVIKLSSIARFNHYKFSLYLPVLLLLLLLLLPHASCHGFAFTLKRKCHLTISPQRSCSSFCCRDIHINDHKESASIARRTPQNLYGSTMRWKPKMAMAAIPLIEDFPPLHRHQHHTHCRNA